MRVTISNLLSSLLLAASASANEANVYLFHGGDSQHIDSQSLSTSASTARLVFAQRLDLAQYHSLKDADEDAIQVLNEFGGRPRKLFGGDATHSRPKAMFVVEGVENVQDIAPTVQVGSISSFSIQDPPTASANAHLLQDLTTQANTDNSIQYSDLFYNEASSLLKQITGEESATGFSMSKVNGRVFTHLTSLEQISTLHGSSSAEYKSAATSIREAISAFFEKSSSRDWEVILVAMPPKQSGGIFKRSSTASWGSYALPKRQTSGRPDFLPNDYAGTETNIENPPHNEINYDEFLDPLEPQGTDDLTIPGYSDVVYDDPAKTTHTFSDTLEEMLEDLVDEIMEELTPAPSNPLSTLQQETDTTPPLGILPTCYSTLSACISTTHNCSGHGSCYRKFTDERNVGKRDCFVCGCKATYRRDDQDRIVKTTVWAGPACQKKDVSVPFWLLGGLTVLLVSVVAWGIGLLYSMGSEDLPSVIGAGVAGPRVK